jgi:hypothetical protein
VNILKLKLCHRNKKELCENKKAYPTVLSKLKGKTIVKGPQVSQSIKGRTGGVFSSRMTKRICSDFLLMENGTDLSSGGKIN